MNPDKILLAVAGIAIGMMVGCAAKANGMYDYLNKKFDKPEVRGVAYPDTATGGAVRKGYVDMHGTVYICLPKSHIRGGVKTYGWCDGREKQYVLMHDAVPQNKKLVRFKMSPISDRGMGDVEMYWK